MELLGNPGQHPWELCSTPVTSAARWECHMAPLGTPGSTTGPLKHPKNPRWRAGTMDGTPGTLNCTLGIPLSPWELLQHPRDTRQHSRNPCGTLGTLDGTLGNLAARPELLQHPRIPAPPHAHRDLAPLGTLCQHPATSRAQCQHTVRTLDPSDLCQHPVCVGTLCWHPAPMGTLGDTEPSGTLYHHVWEHCASTLGDTARMRTLCQHPWGHNAYKRSMPAFLGTPPPWGPSARPREHLAPSVPPVGT